MKKILLPILLIACAPKVPLQQPTTAPVSENTMSGSWLKDEPLKICPISAGVTTKQDAKGINERVTNGSAFDCYGFSFAGIKKVVVPSGAEVNETAAAGTMVIKANKSLGFGGHPPKPMSPETARAYMGLAYRIEGETLHLATYGEFSTKEGGASMKLVVSVPAGLELARETGYQGMSSAAATERFENTGTDYWYTGTKPAPTWTALNAVAGPFPE